MAAVRSMARVQLSILLATVGFGLGIWWSRREQAATVCPGALGAVDKKAPVLVSYSYFEKDPVQRENFVFFLETAVAAPNQEHVTYVIVVSGTTCTPCQQYSSLLERRAIVLYKDNEGMDFAAHNSTFEYMRERKHLWNYAYYFLLNSSVKGPFYPAYMPSTWHWTQAYIERFSPSVHAVGSSLVCLPAVDAGGPGPRLESWAAALDATGLEVTTRRGVFEVRTCKLCTDNKGIVVGGEYGLSMGLFAEGHNVATLMSRYARDVDWKDKRHWNCNDNVHPSRHGTYGGIAFHPYETVFVKASWHVADPYTHAYGKWRLQHANGSAGTDGAFDEKLYRYAISPQAQEPNKLAAAYKVI